MKVKRKIIVFGAGPHARDLLVPSLLATGRCELAAWIDPAEPARRLAAGKFPDAPFAARFDPYRVPADALAIIATPTVTHRAIFESVYDRGLDCFIEKPLAATYADALAMCRRVRAGGPRATVGLWMRHAPLIASLRRLIPAPRRSQLEVRAPPAAAGDWPRILDTFIYLIDLALATHPSPPATVCVKRREPLDCEIGFADASRSRLTWRDAQARGKEQKWSFAWEDQTRQARVRGLAHLEVYARAGEREYDEHADYWVGFRYQLQALLRDRFLTPLPLAAEGNRLFDVMVAAKVGRNTPLESSPSSCKSRKRTL